MEPFTHVVFNGLRYKISGIKYDNGIFVSNGTVKELGPLVLWVYQNGYYNYAYLGHFFYDKSNKNGDHEIDKKAFFAKIVGAGELAGMDPGRIAQLEKNFADDVFAILCMIARFYKCKAVTLNDSSVSKGFPMCNYRYKMPYYVNYYGRKGFVECEIDINRKPVKQLTLAAAVKEGNRQIAVHQIEASLPFDPANPELTNEQAVAAYYKYKRAEPVSSVEPVSLPPCSVDMARYMDDTDMLVWEFDEKTKKSRYIARGAPYTVMLTGTALIIDSIDRKPERRVPVKKVRD